MAAGPSAYEQGAGAEPRRQRRPRDEGVLPTPGGAALFGAPRSPRPACFARPPRRIHGVLRDRPGLADADGAAVDPRPRRPCSRSRDLARGSLGPLSRRPARASIPPPDLVLRDADRVCGLARPRGLALRLCAEPDGRHRPRLPLGARGNGAAGRRAPRLGRRGTCDPRHRAPLLRRGRPQLRGRGVMPGPAIVVAGLSKRYRLGEWTYPTLVEALVAPVRRRPPPELVWALRDVSLTIEEGEPVGVIGRNGAGKTTLLKVLARITHPTARVARMRGRLGALLDV